MKDIIICVWNNADTGKSSSVFDVYNQLLKKGAVVDSTITNIAGYTNPYTIQTAKQNEVLTVLNYKGLRIGIESQGDPNGRQFNTLPELRKCNCNIIICASRTGGATCSLVVSTAGRKYDLIWFSNFYFDNKPKNMPRHNSLNSFNARSVVSLIDELIAGKI